MNASPVTAKDLAVLMALKPFLSPKGQELVDMMVNVIRLLTPQGDTGIDREALANLVEILRREEG